MRIVALLTVRNEALYLERCLQHLCAQGLETCVIDNDSIDGTRDIAESFRDRGVCRIERLPYEGYFDLVAQCRQQERLANEIVADWFVHHDADEIMEAPGQTKRLLDAVAEVDMQGNNAINCDEFVFLPTAESEKNEGADYVATMRRYYFFEPTPCRLVRFWKRHPRVSLHQSGGHGATFPDRRLHPTPFILRHYIGLSADYLGEKYARRIFSEHEAQVLGWHGWRAEFAKWRIQLPYVGDLKEYHDDGVWDKSDPKTTHQFVVRQPVEVG